MIGIIDISIGNISSIQNWCDRCEIPWQIVHPKDEISEYSLILLPGVGSAGRYMRIFKQSGLESFLEKAITSNKRILGICLGAQILFNFSEEENTQCLGLLEGRVTQLPSKKSNTGWSKLSFNKKNLSTEWISQSKNLSKRYLIKDRFFFNHNFGIKAKGEIDLQLDLCHYPKYLSIVHYKNLLGLQFRPEKSQKAGDELLKMIY